MQEFIHAIKKQFYFFFNVDVPILN